MSGLARQRCFNHAEREAVARCLSCEEHYCRECVSEHEGRYLCAACIARSAEAHTAAPTRSLPLAGLVSLVVGLMVLSLVFFAYARLVFAIPAEFHFHERAADSVWSVEGEYYEGAYEGEGAAF